MFRLGAFEVFWSSKRSTVQKDERLGLQLLQFPCSSTSTSSASTPYTNSSYQRCLFHYPTMERQRNRKQDRWTWYLHGEAQGQGGSDSGIKALSDVKCPLHPEVHYSQKGPSSWPRRWFTHLCTQVDKLLTEARITRYSEIHTSKSCPSQLGWAIQISSFPTSTYNPNQLLHRRISTFTRPSDDDDGHPTAWRLKCSPLIMALIFNRYERHQPGEHDQRNQLRHPQLRHPHTTAKQRHSELSRCLISISFSYHLL